MRLFDPAPALDGGADGLNAYRALLPQVEQCLKPTGLLALEISSDQGEAVSKLLRDSGFWDNDSVVIRRDLAGQQRCVFAAPQEVFPHQL